MKRLKHSFPIRFEIQLEESTHKVGVVCFATAKAMRRYMTMTSKECPGGYDGVQGACWQPDKFDVESGVFSEIALCAEYLNIETISHECTHAAWYRAKILGGTLESSEEQIATDTGYLANAIFTRFVEAGFKGETR